MKIKTKNSDPSKLETTLAIAFFALSFVMLLLNGSLVLHFSPIFEPIRIRFLPNNYLSPKDASKVAAFIQEKFSALETASRI